MTTLPVDSGVPQPASEARPFYWSVRRELWENRSIYIAPLIVTAVILFATAISTVTLPRRLRASSTLDPANRHAAVVMPYATAPAPIILSTLLVGVFYCLDALHGERRDRSILFWKSLPVSDVTAVLSKAMIPLVVLPVIGFVLGQVTQIILLCLSTVVLAASDVGATALWREFHFIQTPFVLAYGLVAHILWFAPIYGWLLLVSAWARRTPVLWATFPVLAIALAERIVFHTAYFGSMLRYRFTGAMIEAFAPHPLHGAADLIDRFAQLDPLRFLSAPGLWVGLGFAVACLAGAARLRRHREPI
jgi:ABC-2 type transport system permease protein